MTKLIRKIFIKDYDNVGDQAVRCKHGVVAAVFGIAVNILLFTFKLLIGIFTLSLSIISDAVNNLGDMFSCIANIIGFKVASKPADKDHPFGHERVEYIAGLIIAFLILISAVVLGYGAVTNLISAELTASFTIWAFVILGVSVVIKIILGLFYRGMGKAISSVSLQATMRDSFNDAATTLAVLVCGIVQYFAPAVWWLDGAMSIAIAVIILISGIKMVGDTVAPLLGSPPDGDFVATILADVASYKGVLGIHDVMCHSYGPTKLFMTVHVEVDGYADTFDMHELVDSIENELGEKYNLLLTVHTDPVDTRSEVLPKLKSDTESALYDIDPRITFHDLRIIKKSTASIVKLDMVFPPDFKAEPQAAVDMLVTALKRDYPDYKVEPSIDHLYL